MITKISLENEVDLNALLHRNGIYALKCAREALEYLKTLEVPPYVPMENLDRTDYLFGTDSVIDLEEDC